MQRAAWFEEQLRNSQICLNQFAILVPVRTLQYQRLPAGPYFGSTVGLKATPRFELKPATPRVSRQFLP